MATRRQVIGALGAALVPPLWTLPAIADPTRLRLAVVVARSHPGDNLSLQDLKNLYRGDRIPGWIPFAFPAGTPERIAFDLAVLGLTPENAARYWIDRKLRGQSGPPRSVDSADLVMRVVEKLEGGVAYVRAGLVRDSVKALRIDGKAVTEEGYPVEH
jgi:hypothetical protein